MAGDIRLVTSLLGAVLLACALPGPAPPGPDRPPTSAGPSPLPASKSASPIEAADDPRTASLAAPAPPAQPSYPFQEPLADAAQLSAAPATRYAKLTPGACRAELAKQKLRTRPAAAKGVATPLRLAGPLHGVSFVAPGSRSVYGKLDCRLVLALAELARVVTRYGVVKVHVDNLYRPRARLPGKKKRSQHAHGLAADIRGFELADGRTLLVERDWLAPIASAPCGPTSVLEGNAEEAITLRNIVCDLAREGVFHHMLTPSYDAAHRDHVHMDIQRDARSFIVR